jgi:hypothetical protein
VTELALSFARPGAAWALLLAPALLLLLRLLARPPEVVVGTLELWKDVPGAAPRGAGARGRLPPWALVAALGLLLGALAWLGPRGARARAERRWTCVVDLSPSMGLAASPGGVTRLDAALAAATAWLAENAGRADRVRWLAEGRAPLELSARERPRSTWLAGDEETSAEPAWELHDEPGTLWITDRAPPVPREHAGLFAGGGAAVPGAIAADGRETVRWDGGALERVPTAGRLAVLVLEPGGAALPAVVERVLAAWSAARGLEVSRESGGGALLTLALEPLDGPVAPVALARDGWSATGVTALADELDERADLGEDWLVGRGEAGPGPVVVRARPGRVTLALRELSEPAGDPALFALSWARLFDRCARLPEGVVPLAERLAAGDPVQAPPRPPPALPRSGRDLGPHVDAALSLAAAACAALAVALLRRP